MSKYVAYDYIKQLYKFCDDENLEPIWLRYLDKFLESYKKQSPSPFISKQELMKDLQSIQCNSETSKNIFDEYFNSQTSRYVYNELVLSILSRLWNRDFISEEIRPSQRKYVFFGHDYETSYLLTTSDKKHTAKTLIEIFENNTNEKKWAKYGVPRETLVMIYRARNLVRDRALFFKCIEESFKQLQSQPNIDNVLGYTNDIISESEKFEGLGSKDAFGLSIGAIKYHYSQQDFDFAIDNKEFMQIFNKANANNQFFNLRSQINLYLSKNLNNPNNRNRVKKLLAVGFYVDDNDDELILTNEDVDILLSMPKGLLANLYKFYSDYEKFEENKRHQQKLEKLKEKKKVFESLSSNQQFIALMDKLKAKREEEKTEKLKTVLKWNIVKFIQHNKNNPDQKERIAKLIEYGFSLNGSKTDTRKQYERGWDMTDEEIDFILTLPKIVIDYVDGFEHANKLAESRHAREEKEQKLREERERARQEIIRQREEAYRLKHEAPSFRTGEQHYVMLNTEIDNLTQIIIDKMKAPRTLSPQERCYLFNELDFHLSKSHSTEALIAVLTQRIKNYYREAKTSQFSKSQLARTLQFLESAEKTSKPAKIKNHLEYLIDGKQTAPTKEQVEYAREYLKENHVAMNELNFNYALRRLIIGGDIESKFAVDCISKGTEQLVSTDEGQEIDPLRPK